MYWTNYMPYSWTTMRLIRSCNGMRILLGLRFMTFVFHQYGTAYGVEFCTSDTCGSTTTNEYMSNKSSTTFGQCKTLCYKNPRCQMIMYQGSLCSLYKSRLCLPALAGTESPLSVYYCYKDCGIPPTPANGTVLLATGDVTTEEATAIQACYPGYVLNGTTEIICRVNGFWSAPPVRCSLKDCGIPTAPGNGNVSLDSGTTTFGSFATRKCDPGYVIDGNATIYCEEDGAWSDLPLTCSLEDCGKPPTPDNGSVLLNDGVTTYQATASQSCNPDCGLPPSPLNGAVILTAYNVTTYGSSATQSCNIGYDLAGDVNISCGSDGNWSHQPVSCTLTDCGLPPSPLNGAVILTAYNVTTYGSSATQSCNIGYDLAGDVNISCGRDGNWSHQPVSCTLTDCNDPPAPSNGIVNLTTTGMTSYKATAKLYCYKGYTLKGNATMVCEADGIWSQHAECTINDCKTPDQPDNGAVELTVDGVTTYGATASSTCNTGYELNGDGFLWCKANGVWSVTPSCHIKAYIPAVAATSGAVGLGIASVCVYWLVYRRCMNPLNSVSTLNSDSDKKDNPDHVQSADGVTPDVEW